VWVKEYLTLHNSNLTGSANVHIGGNLEVNGGMHSLSQGSVQVNGSLILNTGDLQVKNSPKITVGVLNGSSSSVVVKNVTSLEINGGIKSSEASFEFKDIKSTNIVGDSTILTSSLTTDSNISVNGAMSVSSSDLIMTMGSVLQVSGIAQIDDSKLNINVKGESDLGYDKIMVQSSSGLNGQFKTVEVNDDKRLTKDCEKLKATPTYSDESTLSVFIRKDSGGCVQSVNSDAANGVEVAMIVLVIVFGVAIVAVTVIFLVLKKNRYNRKMDELVQFGTQKSPDRERSNLPGE